MTPPDHDRTRAAVERSEHDLLAALADLDDTSAAGPSGLPDWSRGHVLTHLARNAETFVDALEAAGRGEVRTMYDGSVDVRNAAIEAGAGRPAAELLADVGTTSGRLHDLLRELTPEGWQRGVRHLRGDLLRFDDVLWMRWQEVEIHRVDLALGYRPADWPADFVEGNLPRQLARLPERAPGVAVPERPAAEVLGWLYGRGAAELPALPPWP